MLKDIKTWGCIRIDMHKTTGRDNVGHKDISSQINRERQTEKLPAGHKLIGSRGSATKEVERRSGSIGHHSMNSRGSRQLPKTIPPKVPLGHRSMHVEHPEIVSSTLSPKDHRVTYPSDYNYLAKNSRGDGNLNLNKYKGEVEQRHPSHFQPHQSRRHTEAIFKPTNRIVPEETKLADELQRRQIQQHEKINQRPDSTRKKSRHVHFNNPS
ncbi:uncharacterized protein LOC106664410 isoform X3 [Cimex lectularius]|uniref:Uncharacterized protein n=1 Tax=Cimex lectularius TaxID=79782 RepID=A0A8I6RLH0_CIMLE|nr:uncharacterized protein LOC106664410 isoform X3 [Cimex lectularius]